MTALVSLLLRCVGSVMHSSRVDAPQRFGEEHMHPPVHTSQHQKISYVQKKSLHSTSEQRERILPEICWHVIVLRSHDAESYYNDAEMRNAVSRCGINQRLLAVGVHT